MTTGRDRRAVVVWLALCAAMVFAMVVLGGATRLTESGLSMVDWRPLIGVLPPLGEAEWQATFAQYRTSPQFRTVNFWMSVDDFKTIYWLEYIHRLWGRLIGVAFGLPLIWFAVRGSLDRPLALRLTALLVLGGLQGLMGWYMVKSGLVDRPEVSQYRLAAHLALAFLIYGYMLWLVLVLSVSRGPGPVKLRRAAMAVLGWISLTVIAGAFVAGLDAGLAYNTFPLMDGRLVPEGAMTMSPWVLNLFENAALVQFNHRVAGIVTVLVVAGLWIAGLRAGVSGPARNALHLLAAAAAVQFALGIATLIGAVALVPAIAHQTGALVLFSAAVWAVYELATPDSAPAGSLRANSTAPAR